MLLSISDLKWLTRYGSILHQGCWIGGNRSNFFKRLLPKARHWIAFVKFAWESESWYVFLADKGTKITPVRGDLKSKLQCQWYKAYFGKRLRNLESPTKVFKITSKASQLRHFVAPTFDVPKSEIIGEFWVQNVLCLSTLKTCLMSSGLSDDCGDCWRSGAMSTKVLTRSKSHLNVCI